jgi:hypothetical protein
MSVSALKVRVVIVDNLVVLFVDKNYNMEWVSTKERYPEKDGLYEVKVLFISMNAKVTETRTHFISQGPNLRKRFIGEAGGNRVLFWKEIEGEIYGSI